MPHLFSDIPDKLRMILSQAANTFLVIVLIYIIQYIFNAEFSCSCTPQIHNIVYIYIVVIPLILFFVLKIVKQSRSKICFVRCCGLFPQLFQLLGICVFWWGFVLLDGDFYLCITTKFDDKLVEIPCKKNHTLQEMSMITIYKNNSQCYGYIIIAVGLLGWCVLINTKIGICCNNRCQKCVEKCCCDPQQILCYERLKTCCKRKPYYEQRYEELLFEETDKHLDEALQEIAKMRAKSICDKHIDAIKSSQFSKQTNQTSVAVDDAWSTISQSDFYTSPLSEDLNSVGNVMCQIHD